MRTRSAVDIAELPVSVSVTPLVQCDDDLVKTVRKAVRLAVGYLEDIAGVRYYPVPTFIISRHQTRVREKIEVASEVDEEVVRDTIEIIRFITIISLTYHCSRGNEQILGPRSDREPDLSEQDRLFYQVLEGLGIRMEQFARGSPVDTLPSIPGMTDACGGFMEWCQVLLERIHDLLNALCSLDVLVVLPRWYFEGIRISESELDSWRRRLSRNEFEVVREAIDANGEWRRDAQSVFRVFKIAAENALRLLEDLDSVRRAKSTVTKLRNLFGFYYAPLQDVSGLEQSLSSTTHAALPAGLPVDTGMVFICKDEIRDAVEADDTGYPDKNELLRRLVISVVVHEHMHAAVREGLDQVTRVTMNPVPSSLDEKRRIVNEGLAEWVELNLYRTDPQMSKIILDHAQAGFLPSWPYRAALLVETLYSTGGIAGVTNLVRAYRFDVSHAYDMLMKQRQNQPRLTAKTPPRSRQRSGAVLIRGRKLWAVSLTPWYWAFRGGSLTRLAHVQHSLSEALKNGYAPLWTGGHPIDLRLVRAKRNAGKPLSPEEKSAWRARVFLEDVQIGDLLLYSGGDEIIIVEVIGDYEFVQDGYAWLFISRRPCKCLEVTNVQHAARTWGVSEHALSELIKPRPWPVYGVRSAIAQTVVSASAGRYPRRASTEDRTYAEPF